jgi:hypothetical protein
MNDHDGQIYTSGGTALLLEMRSLPPPAPEYRQEMAQRFQSWREITGTVKAA